LLFFGKNRLYQRIKRQGIGMAHCVAVPALHPLDFFPQNDAGPRLAIKFRLHSGGRAAIVRGMNNKHRKTLEAVFADPADGRIEWRRIEALLIAVGCRVVEGSGSSVGFEKNGARVRFHRPHPNKEALKYRVKDARAFLQQIGVTP
jgi:hypothetical protein